MTQNSEAARRRRARIGMAALLPVALAACGPTVTNEYRSSAYTSSEIRSVSTMPVEVHGPVPAEAIVAAMPATAVGLRQFVPLGSGGSFYRVVWSTAGGAHPDSLCSSMAANEQAGNPSELVAALCRGTTALTYATSDAGADLTPRSPRFTQLVRTMTMALFPPGTQMPIDPES